MESTFNTEDCVYLLKDLTGIIKFTSFEDKERLISNGVNYSEMITEEEQLSNEICKIFEDSLQNNASELAYYVGVVAEQIYRRGEMNCIIVSLARAGSPIGAIIKRYIKFKYNVKLPHYSISIIRGRGIDKNALNFIRSKHPNGIINFVDAWTGKGSITRELHKAVIEYNREYSTNISYDLAVLADPAHLSTIAGTRKDICIPNACLNSTVSGLVSRTIVLLCEGNNITEDDLELYVEQETSPVCYSLKDVQQEKERIKQALEQCGGNKVSAAKLLKIGRTTLYAKMKEYGLN